MSPLSSPYVADRPRSNVGGNLQSRQLSSSQLSPGRGARRIDPNVPIGGPEVTDRKKTGSRTKPKAPRRRLQNPNPEMRPRLLEAATSLMREVGFTQAKIERIAERAGVSVGTFYLYFDSKDDLFLKVITDDLSKLRTNLRKSISGAGTPAEKIFACMDAYMDFIEADSSILRHFYRDYASASESRSLKLGGWVWEVIASDLAAVIQEAMDFGVLAKRDASLTSHALVGLVHHLAASWLGKDAVYTREQISDFLATFVLSGLGPSASVYEDAVRIQDMRTSKIQLIEANHSTHIA